MGKGPIRVAVVSAILATMASITINFFSLMLRKMGNCTRSTTTVATKRSCYQISSLVATISMLHIMFESLFWPLCIQKMKTNSEHIKACSGQTVRPSEGY
jgi:hypothetical protein